MEVGGAGDAVGEAGCAVTWSAEFPAIGRLLRAGMEGMERLDGISPHPSSCDGGVENNQPWEWIK